MKFFENVKRRKRIAFSTFFRNKSRIVEIFVKIFFYLCMSYNLFITSSALTFDMIGSPFRWPIIVTAIAIPIIVAIAEFVIVIKQHLRYFEINPVINLTSDVFIYQFNKIRKTGEVIEVKYKTKPSSIENIYVDENKETMFIKAPFDIANDEDVIVDSDDALFIPIVFHERDKLLYFIEYTTHKRIERLK